MRVTLRIANIVVFMFIVTAAFRVTVTVRGTLAVRVATADGLKL